MNQKKNFLKVCPDSFTSSTANRTRRSKIVYSVAMSPDKTTIFDNNGSCNS